MVLMLSAAKAVVKDAARAVKRVSGLTIQTVTAESLTQLLDLPGMKVTHFAIETQGTERYLHLFCQHQHNVAICPVCSEAMAGGYDHKDRCVRHLDMWGMRTLVHFPQRRFECSICSAPFTEQLCWIDAKRRQTRAYDLDFVQFRYEAYIYQRVHKTTRKHVALQEGLSESTVMDIFQKCAKQAIGPYGGLVRVLGVDEISVRKGHKNYALVLSDLEQRCVIAVLPDRQKDTLEKWLDDLTEQERQAIKVVSMDMWRPYRSAVRTKLPHATSYAVS